MARGFRLPIGKRGDGASKNELAEIERERSERDAARLERLLSSNGSGGEETPVEPYRGPERRAAVRSGPRRT